METCSEGITAGVQHQSHRLLLVCGNNPTGGQDQPQESSSLEDSFCNLLGVQRGLLNLSLFREGLADVGLEEAESCLGDERKVVGVVGERREGGVGLGWGRLGQFRPGPVQEMEGCCQATLSTEEGERGLTQKLA